MKNGPSSYRFKTTLGQRNQPRPMAPMASPWTPREDAQPWGWGGRISGRREGVDRGDGGGGGDDDDGRDWGRRRRGVGVRLPALPGGHPPSDFLEQAIFESWAGRTRPGSVVLSGRSRTARCRQGGAPPLGRRATAGQVARDGPRFPSGK